MFSHCTGNHKCCIKAVISALLTVIMGILLLMTGLRCILSLLHHPRTYNHNSKIHPLNCYCCIKYKAAAFLKKFLHELSNSNSSIYDSVE